MGPVLVSAVDLVDLVVVVVVVVLVVLVALLGPIVLVAPAYVHPVGPVVQMFLLIVALVPSAVALLRDAVGEGNQSNINCICSKLTEVLTLCYVSPFYLIFAILVIN